MYQCHHSTYCINIWIIDWIILNYLGTFSTHTSLPTSFSSSDCRKECMCSTRVLWFCSTGEQKWPRPSSRDRTFSLLPALFSFSLAIVLQHLLSHCTSWRARCGFSTPCPRTEWSSVHGPPSSKYIPSRKKSRRSMKHKDFKLCIALRLPTPPLVWCQDMSRPLWEPLLKDTL